MPATDSPPERMSRRRFLIAALTGVGAVATGYATGEAYRFAVERPSMHIPGLAEPVRIAFLTDLHYGPYVRAGSVTAWVDATMRERPDLVVLGGDLVDAMGPTNPKPLLAALAALDAPLGVFTVWGNHDHARFRRLGEFERMLSEAGITVLRNRGVRVRDDLFLAGIDDVRSGRPDIPAALAERPNGAACILVSHNPDALPDIPTDVDLTLCGHTHGGQIRIPLVGPIFTSSRYGRRFLAGWVSGPGRGYVSRGLGVTLVPLRVACPAELTVLDVSG
ncbi:MAG: metallophosphoesterase [Trueperaceae bacterium]|nr:metallophosphoesterase [Trueperaceae bacterium]